MSERYVVVTYPIEVHGPFDTEAAAEEWAWPHRHRLAAVVPLLRTLHCEFCLGVTDHVPACPVVYKTTKRMTECPRHGGEPEPCGHCALDSVDCDTWLAYGREPQEVCPCGHYAASHSFDVCVTCMRETRTEPVGAPG